MFCLIGSDKKFYLDIDIKNKEMRFFGDISRPDPDFVKEFVVDELIVTLMDHFLSREEYEAIDGARFSRD